MAKTLLQLAGATPARTRLGEAKLALIGIQRKHFIDSFNPAARICPAEPSV